MIRLATCFSGIGAIEHALNRMGLDNQIVFACDNGDVDIFSKKIPLNLAEMRTEFKTLESIVQEIIDGDYQNSLERELENDYRLFNAIVSKLVCIEDRTDVLIMIVDRITYSFGIDLKKQKEYMNLSALFHTNKKDSTAIRFIELLCMLRLQADFLKDNKMNTEVGELKSSYSIEWATILDEVKEQLVYFNVIEGKKIIKSMSDICERLGMLHERIEKLRVNIKLQKMESFDEKKAYIDNLYQGKKSNNKVRETYLANYHIDDRHYHWDVSFLDGKEYSGQVDLFVGGSPCQSFSLVGKQRGLEDTRGTLFYEYARLVQEIKPKVFIYENVKAVLSNDSGKTWAMMSKVFSDLNYNWFYKVLNAKDYGIPQNRERLFVVAFRKDIEISTQFVFPKAFKLNTTMKDFLLDNVSGKYYLPQKGVDFVTSDKNLTKRYTQIDGDVALCQKKNQQFNWHGDFVFEEDSKCKTEVMKDLEKYFLSEKVEKYVLATGTKGFYSKPKVDLDIARPLLTTMHKMHRAGVDNYVTTEGRLRKLTPRECLRLMGFSDSFNIVVSDTAMYQQSGNSIVVDVLMNIMNKVIETYPELIE